MDEALTAIYRAELSRLRGAPARRTGSLELADDAVHEAWIEAEAVTSTVLMTSLVPGDSVVTP